MIPLWMALTVGAAAVQSIRTAAQKQLNGHLTILAGTYVRALFGLPVMVAYLLALKGYEGSPWPQVGWVFTGYVVLTALTQMAATAALLSLLKLRTFAVASQIARSDMVFTAIIGAFLFGQALSTSGWTALLLATLGLGMMMLAKVGREPGALSVQVVTTGLFIGLMFGVCNLTLREATLNVAGASPLMAGALTVVCVTAIQLTALGVWLLAREPGTHRAIKGSFRLALFVGVTSALGSIAWFAAFALETAARVRIVGQIEVVFTLALSVWYFRERPTLLELGGLALTVAGIVVLAAAR
jgi:drug/metabolite transporter (DMT)-like permease